MHLAVQAARLRMDWRPILGFGPNDAGSLEEVVAARFIGETVLELHNADVDDYNAEIADAGDE